MFEILHITMRVRGVNGDSENRAKQHDGVQLLFYVFHLKRQLVAELSTITIFFTVTKSQPVIITILIIVLKKILYCRFCIKQCNAIKYSIVKQKIQKNEQYIVEVS